MAEEELKLSQKFMLNFELGIYSN